MVGTISLLRSGAARLLVPAASQAFALPSSASGQQKRTIVHKSLLHLDPEKYPEPWPYREKGLVTKLLCLILFSIPMIRITFETRDVPLWLQLSSRLHQQSIQ